MAADNELRLISCAIRTRNLAPALEAGIKDDWFYVEDNRVVWKFICSHLSKYGEVPTAVTVKDNFPNYRILAVEDSIEYLIDQLAEYRKRQKAIEVVQDASNAISGGDHNLAVEVMGRGISQIYDETTSAVSEYELTKKATDRFREYQDLKSRPGGLLGLPTGFLTMDQATAGLQPGQLVTIIAPPKTGKSVLAMQVAVNIHEAGYVPMFQSFEMTNMEQKSRHDAMRAHISHNRLIRGQLKTAEEVRYQKSLETLEAMHKFYLTDAVSATTVSALASKVERLNPDVIFVDGVYLMIDEVTGESQTPQALTSITRNLKRLAMRIEKPIVISTQVLEWKMRKGKVGANSIGYSSSFLQDSDVIFALERTDEEDDTARMLKIVASRNCGPAEVDLLWDWEHGKFQEYGSV
jgi:replicative DNA helicase